MKFDPDERKEFLTGFRKRKLQRKAKAREELAKQIKVSYVCAIMYYFWFKVEKARINKEKQEELKKKNEVLDDYVKQFITAENETEEIIESENQTVTIKQVVSFSFQ